MQGDHRVEKYMPTVSNAIDKHVSGQGATEIYNRAFEAVMQAILDADEVSKKDSEAITEYAVERGRMISELRYIRKALTRKIDTDDDISIIYWRAGALLNEIGVEE